MSLDVVFGVPVFKTRMPNHQEILKRFMPFIKNNDNFDIPTAWDCACKTTIDDTEKNSKFPWHLFFENVTTILAEYSAKIGLSNDALSKINGHAWVNRYDQGESQEVHDHKTENNLISCAYMLKLPKNSAQFTFYQSNYEIFPKHLSSFFNSPTGTAVKPLLEEGDIIFFPSSATHYVSAHKTSKVRASISANFNIN